MTVPGLQTKYGLFNVRPFTISHCRCDRRLISIAKNFYILIAAYSLHSNHSSSFGQFGHNKSASRLPSLTNLHRKLIDFRFDLLLMPIASTLSTASGYVFTLRRRQLLSPQSMKVQKEDKPAHSSSIVLLP